MPASKILNCRLPVALFLALISLPEMSRGADVTSKDYPSIQAAIDANPGAEIWVPAGDHLIETTLRISTHGTRLTGSGRILLSDPDRPILEIEHANNVLIAGLTFSRPEGTMNVKRDGVLISDAKGITLNQVKVIDNRSPAAGIRLQNVSNGMILNCEIRNYMTISIDDRTATEHYGYAFNCIDGTGIVCTECRGTLIQGNRIVEDVMRPTPEIKRQFKLGQFVKKNPVKGNLMSQQIWDAEYVNNWHQGSALIVTGPTTSDFTRIISNQIENAAQGIDLHSDHVIVSSNIVDNAFIGMKAMHGSRNVIITGNQFSRSVLWAIGLMSGTAASAYVPAQGDQPAVPGNVDGGSLIANNIISRFGYGDSYWMWTEADRAVFRFDNGQEATDPPLRDVMVMGNVISNPDPDELPADANEEFPRYRYAVRIEKGQQHSPRGLHFESNLFPAGTAGVFNGE